MPIPDFVDGVNLPSGVHFCTWEELAVRFCNGHRREALSKQMQALFARAKACSFVQVIVGGSFATAKPDPGDFEIAWIVNQGVDKAAMRPECLELVESEKSRERFGCDVLYLAIAGDAEKIEEYGTLLGYDYMSRTPRGTLLLDL